MARSITAFMLKAEWYDPTEEVMYAYVSRSYIDSGWTGSLHRSGYCQRSPNHWKTGTYRVDLSLYGKPIASGKFIITP